MENKIEPTVVKILVAGPAGSGKTTIALEIAKLLAGKVDFELKDVDVESNDIKSILSHMNVQERRLAALEGKHLKVIVETRPTYRDGSFDTSDSSNAIPKGPRQ